MSHRNVDQRGHSKDSQGGSDCIVVYSGCVCLFLGEEGMRGGLGSDKNSIVIDPPKMGGVVKLISLLKKY